MQSLRWLLSGVACSLVLAGCASDEEIDVAQQAATIKLSTPTVRIVGETPSSLLVEVCAGPTGARAGFSLQWLTETQAGGGWPADGSMCKGSYSGQANVSRFALGPNACTIVDVGRQLPEPGAKLTCSELSCGSAFVFRAFAHAYSVANNVYMRSEYTADVAGRTQACAARTDDVFPPDVASALSQLAEVSVLDATSDGVVKHIVGDLARAGELDPNEATADAQLRTVLPPVLAPFRLVEPALGLRKSNTDDGGNRHFRYTQTHAGLDVIGGDLIVHVDSKGTVFAVNGPARGDLPPPTPAISPAAALSTVAKDPTFFSLQPQSQRLVYLITEDGYTYLAYEIVAAGERGNDPVLDKVYVDASSGAIVANHPTIHFARNRKIHNAANRSSLPGTLVRSEGDPPSADLDVNAAYDGTGAAYDAYKLFFNRDSYDGAGAAMISSVHYNSNYCNAFWNGTQMVYGDGNGPECLPLARAIDVAAHELTHAVTAHESGLVYSGESGGLNESLSDIFAAFVEAYVDGGRTGVLAISADTWKIGEDVLPPALRYMCDPAADGVSKDYWTSTVGAADVHYSSGVSNLAFCLLTVGGTHPRGKSQVEVNGIGMDKAIRIFYSAQADYLTASSKFVAARNATITAAQSLGYDASVIESVGSAWAAVGVPPAPEPTSPADVVLHNGVAVGPLSAAQGSVTYYRIDVPSGQSSLTVNLSGGTGDADLYVLFGSKPTTTNYACRPYLNGNTETCTFTSPSAGTYWIMLRGYSAYSNVTLKATYIAAQDDGVPLLVNGVPVSSLFGAASSVRYWKISVPAARTLTVTITGGTGDADLYTRAGQKPTTTTFDCRPYRYGNNETCSRSYASAGYVYIMLRGYTSYSGVTLRASY